MTQSPLSEDEIIERFRRRQGSREDVRLGIGDDAAVVALPAGCELIIAVDTLIAGTHFPHDTPAQAVGHRALAVNLSDLAAMGAEPAWATLALSLPEADASWLDGFCDGFFALATQAGVALVGGDTVRGPLAVSVTIHGRVRAGAALTRSGASAGDGLYVTGTLGDAAGGLTTGDAVLLQRFRHPQPRLAVGAALVGVASAAIDLSDGLARDAPRLAAASAAGLRIDTERVPLSAELTAALGAAGARECALVGGDDYELCFTVPEAARGEFERRARAWDCPCTRIGEVVAGSDVSWRDRGREREAPRGGFEHFHQS